MPVCGKPLSYKEIRLQRKARWSWLAQRYGVKRGGHSFQRHGAHRRDDQLSLRFRDKGQPGYSKSSHMNYQKYPDTLATRFQSNYMEWKARHAWLELFSSELKAAPTHIPFARTVDFGHSIGYGVGYDGRTSDTVNKATFVYLYDKKTGMWTERTGYPDSTSREAHLGWRF